MGLKSRYMRDAHHGHRVPLSGEDLRDVAGAHHLILRADLGAAAAGEDHERIHGTFGCAVGVEGLRAEVGVVVCWRRVSCVGEERTCLLTIASVAVGVGGVVVSTVEVNVEGGARNTVVVVCGSGGGCGVVVTADMSE